MRENDKVKSKERFVGKVWKRMWKSVDKALMSGEKCV